MSKAAATPKQTCSRRYPVMMLSLDQIVIDPAIQCRVKVARATVVAYAAAMTEGAQFPPVTVYQDAENVLSDGFQRCAAAKQAGQTKILAEIRPGTRRDALLNAASANLYHGLQPSHADKMRAVVALLADDEWRKWSDRDIGRRCGVDGKTVAAARDESECGNSASTRTFITRHGTVGHRRVPARQRVQASSPTVRKRGLFADHEETLAIHKLERAVDEVLASNLPVLVTQYDTQRRQELAAHLRQIADALVAAP